MKKNISISEEDMKRFNALFARSIWQQLHDAFEHRSKDWGLTKTDLAKALNVNKSVISRRLNGSCNFTLEVISDMARALEYRPFIELKSYESLADQGNKQPYEYVQTTCAHIATSSSQKITLSVGAAK